MHIASQAVTALYFLRIFFFEKKSENFYFATVFGLMAAAFAHKKTGSCVSAPHRRAIDISVGTAALSPKPN